jgi:uncharacterized membrane protein
VVEAPDAAAGRRLADLGAAQLVGWRRNMTKVCRAPQVMLALALLGMAVALYDSVMIYNGQPLWCPPPIAGCNEVASSPYARILDLPVGYFGVVYYSSMFVLAGLLAARPFSRDLRYAALVWAGLGVAFSAYFFYLQIGYIRAFCIYCLVSAVATVLLFLAALAHLRG